MTVMSTRRVSGLWRCVTSRSALMVPLGAPGLGGNVIMHFQDLEFIGSYAFCCRVPPTGYAC